MEKKAFTEFLEQNPDIKVNQGRVILPSENHFFYGETKRTDNGLQGWPVNCYQCNYFYTFVSKLGAVEVGIYAI